MNYWMLVGTPENYEIMSEGGFKICAMKSKRKNYAIKVKPGDKVVFYLTKIQSFAGAAEFVSSYTEDHSALFISEKKGEDYPWRFKIKPAVMLPKEKAVPAETVKDKLAYLKKWPVKYWKLGFQGNVHEIPKEDYETLISGIVNRLLRNPMNDLQ